MTVDLSISIVNWNGGEAVQECLRSLFARSPNIRMEVIVVDNASTDGSPEKIRQEFSEVHLIQNRENKGYAFGNNQAFRASRGRYFLILNNDVIAKDDALEQIVRYMEGHSKVGLLGGRLENPEGTFQPSANRRFPNLLDVLLEEIFFLTSLRYLLLRTPFGGACSALFWNPKKTKPVAWVGGACMLARREALERVGGLDEHFFFYREDCDLCLRLKKGGWQVVYYPHSLFVHRWGFSSRENKRRISIESRRSLLYYFQKHYGRFGFFVAKSFLEGGLLLRYVLLSLMNFLGRDEKERLRLFKEMIGIFNKMKDPSYAFHAD